MKREEQEQLKDKIKLRLLGSPQNALETFILISTDNFPKEENDDLAKALRYLSHEGFIEKNQDGSYSITPYGQALHEHLTESLIQYSELHRHHFFVRLKQSGLLSYIPPPPTKKWDEVFAKLPSVSEPMSEEAIAFLRGRYEDDEDDYQDDRYG